MRGFSKFLAVAAVVVAFAAPAAAAGMNGGGGPQGFGGGPPNPGGAGLTPPLTGGVGVKGPNGQFGPGHGPGGVLSPPNPSGPNAGFSSPDHRVRPPGFLGQGPGGDNRRHRPRHYWLGGGPIFVPEPSGDYVYGNDYDDDGSDATGCWVYRKVYDRAGHFLGFVHVDLCEGQ
jgi:hypothetical protein